ncbi:hypothetical protein WJX73_006811 [Symbiochloris irregularis]|uniref:TOG domain-containing protein n=1 Tax=Symbiochloris irregularis TaxID=706552 RepID=A0AAW1NR07_9CHLO
MVDSAVVYEADLQLLRLTLRFPSAVPRIRALLWSLLQEMVSTRSGAQTQESWPAARSPTGKRRQREPLGETEHNRMAEPAPQPECVASEREVAAANAARQRLYGNRASEAKASVARLPDGPSPKKVDIEYTPSEQLAPCVNPVSDAKDALSRLQFKDWAQACTGITTFRQLARHHPQHCLAFLDEAFPLIIQCVKNLRSQVSKLAIMCMGDFVIAFGDALLPRLDTGGPNSSLLNQLLLKASSNDKRFVVDEAQKALDTLSQQVRATCLAGCVLPYTSSRSPKQRGQAALLLLACVKRMDSSDLTSPACFHPFLQAAGVLVTDNTREARDASRTVISLVHAAFEASLNSSNGVNGSNGLNGLHGASMTDTAHEGDLASPSTEGPSPTGSGPPQFFRTSSKPSGINPAWQLQKLKETSLEDIEGGNREGEIQALRSSVQESGNEADSEQPSAWTSYCRRSLAPTLAAAVLKVSS